MSQLDPHLFRQVIRKTVAHQTGGTADAKAIAQATQAIWDQVSARLAPVIGPRGVEVLLSRAVYLSSRSFPWLTATAEPGLTALEGLRKGLASREAADAADAGCVVLEIFTGLLAALIGRRLSDTILGPVWAPEPLKKERVS